ncbi:uncharacterized protein LTR77_004936 [Saxophila tyrrhenica]|uniref:Mitochondrial ribosomal protein S35 n=1 Tax=Saxophila tyrrhenica TaxID=1690608 RepID=A0AAV9PAW2_9PEZI|nr:hypothetical protein LTR77_004936 [Saxophila tyrrhenica]
MPPRIPSHRVCQYSSSQCFRTRPQPPPEACEKQVRQFHHTPRNATRLRRNMFAWLNGPGKVFRDPLPSSTNYLSAYDKSGNLLRARQENNNSKRNLSESDVAELDENEEELQNRDRESGLSQEDVRKRSDLRQLRRREREDLESRGGVPKERAADLRPYPLNQQFRSQPVLSEDLREKIYELVALDRLDLKSVSATFGIDIRRVAAVVRLKSVEKQWLEEGKRLAKPYNDAVMAMLPQTAYVEGRAPQVHESINDLPVHPYTRQQVFVPTSESRAYTREDAAKAFHPNLLPADKRIPHPELIQIAKWEAEGHDRESRQRLMQEKDAEAAAARADKERRQQEYEARTQVVVKGRRWDFKFQDVSAEKTGKDGRGRHAVGHRYGMPLEDRKRGQVKIPTSVE